MNNKIELENAVKAMRILAKSTNCVALKYAEMSEYCRIIARTGPRIPYFNFYHGWKLRVCRWFGLSIDWVWEIKDKKGR